MSAYGLNLKYGICSQNALSSKQKITCLNNFSLISGKYFKMDSFRYRWNTLYVVQIMKVQKQSTLNETQDLFLLSWFLEVLKQEEIEMVLHLLLCYIRRQQTIIFNGFFSILATGKGGICRTPPGDCRLSQKIQCEAQTQSKYHSRIYMWDHYWLISGGYSYYNVGYS